jgi:acyl-CoA synthetase (NDP forming)
MQTQTYTPTNNTITIDERIDVILNNVNFGTDDEAMKKYIKSKLGEQIIQRTLLEMLKDIPSEKFSAFIEFIEKDASQNALLVYLSAIYPNAEKVITQKAEEVVREFEAG